MLPFLIKAFLTLFVVIDPIGLIPIFLALVGHQPIEAQTQVARQAIVVAAGIILMFSLAGSWLLRYLGISLEAFQVAAGILLLKVAMDMVFSQQEFPVEEVTQELPSQKTVSIFPLAIPLIAGPGTLVSILTLAGEANAYPIGLMLVLAIAAIILAIAYLFFYFSTHLAKLFSPAGIDAVNRVLGVLLSALAVQYIIDGSIVTIRAAFGL
jgi:multiple antibiotic resistance protein